MNEMMGASLGRARLGVDADSCDRIFLRDYVRDVEIGVFDEEYGRTQNLRFTVTLDVPRRAPDAADEVETVVSYDLIVEAIEALIAGPRMQLVETFADRLAARLLSDERVLAATIVIEKLDRVVGSLGVEITRVRPVAVDQVSGI